MLAMSNVVHFLISNITRSMIYLYCGIPYIQIYYMPQLLIFFIPFENVLIPVSYSKNKSVLLDCEYHIIRKLIWHWILLP